jgi:arylformamidase
MTGGTRPSRNAAESKRRQAMKNKAAAEPLITRRTVLGAGAASAMMTAAGPVVAQQAAPAPEAPRIKGPRVWLDMDQKELDDAYDQSVYAPNRQQVTGRQATNSAATRMHLGPPQRHAYGPTAVEGLDVYPARRGNAPVNVFIHGGAWRSGLASNSAFLAELFVHAGAHFVALDFINVLEAGGSLTPMADQVRRGLAWVYRNARMFGGDPDRIYVSGFSSGGHLAAVALTTDWTKDHSLPADILKGGLCCSGIFDLKPVRLSARSRYVRFTDEMEQALSPQRHLDKLNAPLIVAHGTFETPEFQRQARDFAAAVKSAGKPVQFLVGEGYNHFEMIETLASPYGVLGRAALSQMGLTRT